jgi:hypothetical protein
MLFRLLPAPGWKKLDAYRRPSTKWQQAPSCEAASRGINEDNSQGVGGTDNRGGGAQGSVKIRLFMVSRL